MIVTAAVFVGLVFVLLRVLAHSMTYPASQAALPPNDGLARVGARLVTYTTSDGLTLRGARFDVKGDGPVVLFFHGNGEAAVHRLQVGVDLARLGVGSLLAEYRGYGSCSGWSSEKGLYEDAEAALKALGVPLRRVVLVGQSLGSGVATELAVRHPSAKRLVLISPYTSLLDLGRTIAGPFAFLGVSDRFDSLAKIGAVRCPVTILHGVNDEVVPFAMGQRLAKARPDATLVPIPGRGHNDIEDVGRRIAEAVGR